MNIVHPLCAGYKNRLLMIYAQCVMAMRSSGRCRLYMHLQVHHLNYKSLVREIIS